MATSEYVAKPSKPPYIPPFVGGFSLGRRASQAGVNAAVMMAADTFAVLLAMCLASIFRFDGLTAPTFNMAPSDWTVSSLPLHPGYLVFFTVTLLLASRREGLYGPLQTHSLWHELRRTIQACFTAGLLLCGGMYVMHNTAASRAVVAYLLCLTTLFLCSLRSWWRYSLYRRYESGLDTRNVLIVGSSHIAEIVRRQISGNYRLGRTFKGFLSTDKETQPQAAEFTKGSLQQLAEIVRQHFIDEVIIAEKCATCDVIEMIETARDLDVELLVIPGFYDQLTPEAPIEYLGNFPVAALHRSNSKAIAHFFKRVWDFSVSLLLLTLLSPTLLAIAAWIKLTSEGPVLYSSDRVGKKGRIFRCLKFRTMVANAEALQHGLREHNERDSILFKIKNDPRVTSAGRILRKYSLDELPQLLNVLRGDMSLVGPRPPIASEVERYQLQHFRRLEVLPGLTGLWQVRARQDPSFERYVGLDLAYVENWSFWLDLKILVRTAEVVLRGTGS
jgi:exopolysaccharide biosynthesis polyprenyl glycosylphosphotransferase